MHVMTISKTVFDRSNYKKILLLDFAEKLPAGKNKSLLNIEDGRGLDSGINDLDK